MSGHVFFIVLSIFIITGMPVPFTIGWKLWFASTRWNMTRVLSCSFYGVGLFELLMFISNFFRPLHVVYRAAFLSWYFSAWGVLTAVNWAVLLYMTSRRKTVKP